MTNNLKDAISLEGSTAMRIADLIREMRYGKRNKLEYTSIDDLIKLLEEQYADYDWLSNRRFPGHTVKLGELTQVLFVNGRPTINIDGELKKTTSLLKQQGDKYIQLRKEKWSKVKPIIDVFEKKDFSDNKLEHLKDNLSVIKEGPPKLEFKFNLGNKEGSGTLPPLYKTSVHELAVELIAFLKEVKQFYRKLIEVDDIGYLVDHKADYVTAVKNSTEELNEEWLKIAKLTHHYSETELVEAVTEANNLIRTIIKATCEYLVKSTR